jgi:hypothetical protein
MIDFSMLRIERLDGQHARLGNADGGELLQRRLLTVVVDVDAVEQPRRCASGAHGVELVVRVVDGLAHPCLRVGDQLVDGCHFRVPSYGVSMTVPISSPATTRPMLPSASSKT